MKIINSLALASLIASASAQVGTGPFDSPVDCTVEGTDLVWIEVLVNPDVDQNANFEIIDLCDGPRRVGEKQAFELTEGPQDFYFCLDNLRKYNFRYADLEDGELLGAPGDFYKLMDQNGLVQFMGTLEIDENIDFNFGSCPGDVEGDPHFKTLAGTSFDFHGQCDVVLMSAPGFMNGVGLDIHARTQARYEYSFVETAAIKIGNDILEVSSYGATQFNGVADAKFPLTMAGVVTVEKAMEDRLNHVYTMDLGNNAKITVKSFKDLVAVQLPGSSAVLGETHSGMFGQNAKIDMVDRAGNALTDPTEYGMEWQVRDTDPSLFQNMEHYPQYPEKCVMPKITLEERRRLGEVKISEEQAKRACEVAGAHNMEACIYDVLATGELDMAGAGVF